MAKINTSEFRTADIYNEKYVQPVMDKIYSLLGWTVMERVEDNLRQYRGADVVLKVPVGNGVSFILTMDEKLDSKRRLNSNFFHYKEIKENRDKASTFCQELHMYNQAKQWQNGWFHPEVHAKALNQYYVYIWINGEKDTAFTNKHGRLEKLTEVEIAVVSHEALVERLCKDPKFEYTAEAMDALIARIKDNVYDWEDDIRFNSPDFAYDETYPYYSGKLKERPINLIIRKKILREISVCAYAFKLTGSKGTEEVTSYRRTKPMPNDKGEMKEQIYFSSISKFTPETVFST